MGGRRAGARLGRDDASKFGLVGLTDTLRAELAPSGIQVVLIEPGAIATPIWDRGTAAGDELLAQLSPAGRQIYGAQIDGAKASAAPSPAHGSAPHVVAHVVLSALTAYKPRPRYLDSSDARVAASGARAPF